MAIQDWLRELNKGIRITPKEKEWLDEKFPHLSRSRNAAALRDLVNLRRALRQKLSDRPRPAHPDGD